MEEPAQVKKAVVELDKFKRRLIRAVARLLVNQRRPEEEIWKELKKETGCDCELLWARMRALTLKKLNRLFLANDCIDAVPAPARMSLTDWLMFDLVLVHQKIDLIGQDSPKDNKEDPQVLVDLFEVVKIFNIENLQGNNLAEAWSLATLYYNNRGHQCSPMLLQRRWYQLREVTRYKFYDFWYAYRGNTTRISHAEPFRPTPLQTAIAKTFKSLVTQPFLEWEHMIEQRLVTMPEEFEEKIKQRSARRKPAVRKPSIDVPDLVMIEPKIDTIDLRQEPDDDATEPDKQEVERILVPPLVKIKEEPRDDMEVDETPPEPPKKSMFEVVLESTDLENLQFDSMNSEEYDPENNDNNTEEIEETTVTDDTEPVMPQIGSVFGNVTDTSVLANIDENRTYASIRNTGVDDNVDGIRVVQGDDTNICNNINTGVPEAETITLKQAEQNVCGKDKDAGDRNNSIDGGKKDNDNCDNMDKNIVQNNVQVIELSSDDKDDVHNIEDIQDTVRDSSSAAGDNIPDEINEISDDDYDISGNGDSSKVLGRIDETSFVGNVVETSVSGNVDKAGVSGSVEATNVIDSVDITNTIGSENETNLSGNIEDGRQLVTNEDIPNIDVLNAQTSNSTATKAAEEKDVEIIDPSQPLVIIDSDEDDDIVDDLIIMKDPHKTTEENIAIPKSIIDEPMEVDTPDILGVSSTEPLKVCEGIVEKKKELAVKLEAKVFNFGALPPGIVFADEGIEFVDKGMAYFDEDSPHEADSEGNEDEDTPQIDPKLLLCPVVYTTRLDHMGLFHTQPFNHINDKQLLDAITKKSKPIKKDDIVKNCCDENIESVTVNGNKKTIEYVPANANSIHDNSIIVKEEPLNVSETIAPRDQIVHTPIQCTPGSDDNDTSDDSDSNDSLDESLKVKPTSYLLQKPRSRRYNPIQLCKNPDFNTRLKRLSVGFFSYPRNRVLIKSCKPLTIDLSKTFESKLISGTLYLKPVDHNVKTEIIIDDTESHSVSVVPSALPAQSLIDNSKVADILPMLHQCVEATRQPVDIPPPSERNRVINLPDITEIRRINQRLLTAEVTPIQVQNNRPQVPVTIVTCPNTPTNSPQETITAAETFPNSRPVTGTVTEATDIRGEPKIVQIDDSPAKRSTENTPSSVRHTDLRFFGGFRPRPTLITGRPPRIVNGKRVFPPKPMPWKPRYLRPEIPWLTKGYEVDSRNETLLTLDALNKMLFLLTDKEEPKVVPKVVPKVLSKNSRKAKRGRPRLHQNDEPGEEEPVISEDPVTSGKPATSEELNTTCHRPRINIKSATNYPAKDKSLDIDSEKAKKKINYCCWARQRMLQLLFHRARIPHHGCDRICQCCCRHLLKDYIMQDEQMKRNELQIISTGGEIPAQAPGVATVPLEETAQVSDVKTVEVGTTSTEGIPVMDVEASSTNENELIEQAVNVEDDVPSLGGEVSVTTTAVVAPLVGRGTKLTRKIVAVPILENNKFISGVPAEAVKPAYQYTCVSSDNQSKGIILDYDATNTGNTKKTPNIISPNSLTKLLAVKKSKAQNTPKTNISVRPPLIKPKPFEPPKHIREKMIFLNAKQISEKPTASPLHLGKNKILLTTIKFPYNLKLFHEAKKALQSTLNLPAGVHIILLADGTVSYKIDPNVEVNATDMKEMPEKIAAVRAHMDAGAAQEQALNKLNVPPTPVATVGEVVDLVDDDDVSAPNVNETPRVASVQTIDENETINIDGSPNVSPISQMNTSNATEENRTDSSISPDMKEMPDKIAAVRAHMDAGAAQEQALNKLNIPPTLAVPGGEVVDLVDDDDLSAPNVNETPLVANVQTTEENETINIDGSPNVSHSSQMDTSNETEENRTDSSISTNAISISTNAIATESNQNVDQNTVIDQESTENEMLSAPTGQLQDHPDPFNKISTDVDQQLTPSSQIKSTDVHEVTAEQSQDQPDPSSQRVSAEIDLAKTSNQIESALVHGGLTEQAEAQSETSDQNSTIEVQDLPKPATQKVNTEVPKESVTDADKPKPKNILSDLMEMSGIFDEDVTHENGQTAVPVPEVVEPPSQVPVLQPAQGPVLPPANSPNCQGTTIIQPMLIPTAFNHPQPIVPKIQSAIGELTAITSLYELKYACANKGVFFKLDMENGYLIPINVCMKGAIKRVRPPMAPASALRNIASKSVIDLTEDDDIPKQRGTDTSPKTLPTFKSLLLTNNSSGDDPAPGPVSKSPDLAAIPEPKPSNSAGPARPVKLFKALKPSILQRLNLNKINQNSSTVLDHKRKRKQFLKNINLNADPDAGLDCAKPNVVVLMQPHLKKITLKRTLMCTYKGKRNVDGEPTATTSLTEPNKEFATTILSDDSSDDEPLAKIAKRKHENMNAPKSVTKEIESDLPVVDTEKYIGQEGSVGEQIESELPVADIENVTMNDNENIDKQAPVDKQNESELPANDVENDYMSETSYMSDDDNVYIDPEAPFGFVANDSNEEDEDNCILGV